MNVSYKWLKEFTNIDVDDKTFMREMCMTGTEITGYGKLSDKLSKIVVGKILEIHKHPDAERLVVCSVDIGENEPIQIVTAATNVFVGATVPLVRDGGIIADGTKIKKGKLRGQISMGMFCSVAELGLTINDYPGAIEDGILILNEGKPGDDVCHLLGLDDTVFIADIMTNRPDCLSVIGVAREASVTFKKDFNIPTPVVTGNGEDINKYIKVNVLNTKLCPRYTTRIITDIKIEPSPKWMIERLRSSGVRAINNIVDITNLVMLEYGQPMHAFDYACISGEEIIVREAKENERITTLDGITRELNNDMLVIADKDKAVGLAGIMGGENSEIKPDTKTVIFESANFYGPEIRRGSKKLGLRTEASARFEKNLDPELTMQALDRACELVELLNAGKVSRNYIDIDFSEKKQRIIPLEKDWINHYISLNLSENEIIDILNRIGCTINNNDIIIPSYRSDIENKYDISEEIARFYGYDKIPAKDFTITSRAAGYTEKQNFEKKIGQTLRANGLSECITFSFISPKSYDKICEPKNSPLRNALSILNPLGEDTSVMRTTAIPSILDVLQRNHSFRADYAWFYELATIYVKNSDEKKLPYEPHIITAGMYGNNSDFYVLKGIIENLLDEMHIQKCEYTLPDIIPNRYHPGRCAEIKCNGTHIGFFGQLHPTVQLNYEIDSPVYIAEINADLMFEMRKTEKEYTSIPKYPAVSRDIALVCNKNVYSAEIESNIKLNAGKFLEKITVFDVYTGQQVPENCKSIAYNITLRSQDHTLTDEETDSVIKKILKGLKEMGIDLRS